MLEAVGQPIRPSQRRIRSNPILEGQRAYCLGMSLREKELRQLSRLLELQNAGVAIHQIPTFDRENASALIKSNERVGVVGLVVDNDGVGYVTKLQVKPSTTWDISVDLPFRQVHIQSLLLRVLSGQGLGESLPELLAYRITDTLADRSEGDSMDIACLLAIVDSSLNHENDLLNAASAVVSPATDYLLEPSKSVPAKLRAFVREFGGGSLLVRHTDDEEAAAFDLNFDQVWTVRNLTELATLLSESDLIRALLEKFSLKTEHALAIASQAQRLLASETTFDQAADFLGRLKRRTDKETPLRIRLEISLAEEDLHRHRGNFDAAIVTRERRVELEQNPLISCYERAADSDNRHAAALYDAHRFDAAIACLEDWADKFSTDPKICLPETRAQLLNTLARCLVVIGDPNWELLFDQSLAIQKVADPGNVPKTTNYLAHGYLKCNRFEDARRVLDINGGETDPFRIWLAAECSRQAGELWNDSQCEKATSINETFHVCGFACQAIARQTGRPVESKLRLFEKAYRSFGHGLESDVTNVKLVLRVCCGFAIAVITDDSVALDQAIQEFRVHCARDGFSEIRSWYEQVVESIERDRDWASVETIFRRIPHL